MEETTMNQTQTTMAPQPTGEEGGDSLLELEDLPQTDDFGEETPPAEGDGTRTADQPDGQPGQAPGQQGAQPPETIQAKYRGQVWELPKKEVAVAAAAMGIPPEDFVTLVQKGMSFDAMERRRPQQPQRPRPEDEILDYYAQANGMNRAQYIQFLQDNRQQMLAQQEQKRLASQFPNADPRLLQEMARLAAGQKESEARQRAAQEAAARQRAQQLQEQARRAPWERFFRAHPDVQAKDLPREMMERVAAGETPLEVWADMELRAKAEELEQFKQQQNAKKRAPGPVGSDGKKEELDPFLQGLG